MTPRLVRVSLLGLILCQVSTAATLTGWVRDVNTNSYLLGATVTVKDLDRAATSAPGGDFVLRNVPAGKHTLVVSYLGYRDLTSEVTVREGDNPALDLALTSEVVQLGKFVVEGSRDGQARALQQKRTENMIMDAVAADAVGKFPDGNAAEALRRVPGVSLEIDQSEGRFVVIRGVDAALNNVTLNGQNVGSPAEQGRRGLAMDSVPADLIARLEVVKAVTPDRDHNAIGGSVNIVTQSAFDRAEPFAFGSLSTGYNDFAGRWGWQAGSVTAGRVIDRARKWAVIGGVSYSRREYSSQTSDAIDWSATNGLFRPATQESFDYDIERTRLGANVALEFRPREGQQFYVRYNYNEFTDEEGRQKTGFNFALGTLTNQTATSGTYSQGRSTKEFRDYKQNHLIDAVSVGGKNELGEGFLLEWQLGNSKAERETPRRVDWEFRSAAGAFPNSYVLGGETPIITPNAAFYAPANFPFRRARFRTDNEDEEVNSGQIDVRRSAQIGALTGFWKVGGKLVKSEKNQDRSNRNYNLAAGAANLFTLGDAGLAGAEPADYMRGRYRFGPTINLPALKSYFQSNPGRFTYDAATSDDNSITADYDATEEVRSVYGMASVNVTPTFTVVGGVRVEDTAARYAANELNTRAGVFTGYNRVNLTKDYTQVLPGLHLNWRPTRQVAVRAAWTNTYGRTNYTDLAPRNVLESVDLGGGVFEGSLSSGNPGLKPFESANLDVSAEYYFKSAGIASVGAFRKRIENPVYRRSFTLFNTTYNGRNFSRLGVTRPENAGTGEITGIEFNYQQFFNQLPGALAGLGVNVNYTITDSSVSVFGRSDELPFFKQSGEIGNVAVLFEKYGIEARVALSFNAQYLESVGNTRDSDEYTDRRRPIDVKISYRINPRLRVFVDFLNVGKEPLRTFTGQPGRPSGYEIYSWNANLGVNWRL
ncbi:TonB-dependent receptor [Horticoccus sp. 23ND18S-11]|uniref:TonB-dependent receptor n=1 Tax=Horticoccus sp. 23ND18S-11 TaxID=3391832 RepID=UPI0039C99926